MDDLIKQLTFTLFYQSTKCSAHLVCLDKQEWLSDGLQLQWFKKAEALKDVEISELTLQGDTKYSSVVNYGFLSLSHFYQSTINHTNGTLHGILSNSNDREI